MRFWIGDKVMKTAAEEEQIIEFPYFT